MWERVQFFSARISQLSIWVPMRILFFYFGKLEVKGWNHLSKIPKDSFILASNHASFLDMFLVSHLFPFGTRFFPFMYPTSPKHYYTWKRFLMWIFGSFPIFKHQGLEISAKQSLSILGQGGRIQMFPEGKIKRVGRMRHARRGVAYLAAKADVPIVPMYIGGFYPLKYVLGFTWTNLFLRRYHFGVCIGKPFFIKDIYGKVPSTMQEYKEAAEKVMKRVYELRGEVAKHKITQKK